MKILAATLILLFAYNLVQACSCYSSKSEESALQNLDAVFQGRVISKEADGKKVKFQVLRAWKGVEKNEIVIENPSGSSSCGIRFKENSVFVVYASGNPLSTSVCTMESVSEKTVRDFLGEGKVFEESASPVESFWSMLWQKFVSFFS